LALATLLELRRAAWLVYVEQNIRLLVMCVAALAAERPGLIFAPRPSAAGEGGTMKRDISKETKILDAMSEGNRSWQHASAAAHHWNSDRELADDLLEGAIQHGALSDALLEGWSWKDALGWLFSK
jgi:hypothetical protein